MIDPVQTGAVASTPASSSDSVSPVAGSASASQGTPAAALRKASSESNAQPTTPSAQGSSGGDAQSASDAAQPLRLLIEHDRATNHYVYKLYDSSGRVVREIPQESLADAQKQAGGAAGVVIDTKV